MSQRLAYSRASQIFACDLVMQRVHSPAFAVDANLTVLSDWRLAPQDLTKPLYLQWHCVAIVTHCRISTGYITSSLCVLSLLLNCNGACHIYQDLKQVLIKPLDVNCMTFKSPWLSILKRSKDEKTQIKNNYYQCSLGFLL